MDMLFFVLYFPEDAERYIEDEVFSPFITDVKEIYLNELSFFSATTNRYPDKPILLS